jgi:hypothetical protein
MGGVVEKMMDIRIPLCISKALIIIKKQKQTYANNNIIIIKVKV